ncbi:unnamed protein product [Miscanthus lutarioriparius]|uniref:Uncharacterized protein n=1 Tax=Miscanthus lutarioriparius TaxID=422564 RepID=A0A811RX69_9POAL|nr:unnamed protein product [Miscanthus lutarioriparius]
MVAEHEKIEWEVRPGGMLVQKRRSPEDDAAAVEYILVRVSTGWQWHDVSIDATATFGRATPATSPRTGVQAPESVADHRVCQDDVGQFRRYLLKRLGLDV